MNAGGSIGADFSAIRIDETDVTKTENLKLLAQQDPTSVVWKDGKITITPYRAISVNEGAVTAQAAGTISISAVQNDLTIKDVSSTGNEDIRLQSNQNVLATEENRISGSSLIVTSGKDASIGSVSSALNAALTGTLFANAGDSIYLNAAEGGLSLKSISATNNVVLKTLQNSAGIQMADASGIDYLRAGVISLSTNNGDIGSAENRLRVLAGDVAKPTQLSVQAGSGSLFLSGVSAVEGSVLTISSAAARNIFVDSQGDLALSGSASAQNKAELRSLGGSLTLSGDMTAQNSALYAKTELTQTSGKVKAASLAAEADGNLTLASQKNELEQATIAASGDAAFYSLSDTSVTLHTARSAVIESAQKLSIANNASVMKNLSLKGASVSTGNVGAGKELSIEASQNIAADDLTAGENIRLLASGSANANELDSKGRVAAGAGSGITLAAVSADGNVDLQARGSLSAGKLNSTDGITAGASFDIAVTQANAAENITLQAGGSLFADELNARKDVALRAGRNMTLAAKAEAGGNIALLSAGSLSAKELKAAGSISAETGGSIAAAGMTAGEDIILRSGGAMALQDLNSQKGITALAGKDITAGNAAASGDMAFQSSANLALGNLHSGGNVLLLGKGSDAAELNFNTLYADGTAIVRLYRGATAYQSIQAGEDAAVGVQNFEGLQRVVTPEATRTNLHLPYGGIDVFRDTLYISVDGMKRGVVRKEQPTVWLKYYFEGTPANSMQKQLHEDLGVSVTVLSNNGTSATLAGSKGEVVLSGGGIRITNQPSQAGFGSLPLRNDAFNQLSLLGDSQNTSEKGLLIENVLRISVNGGAVDNGKIWNWNSIGGQPSFTPPLNQILIPAQPLKRTLPFNEITIEDGRAKNRVHNDLPAVSNRIVPSR